MTPDLVLMLTPKNLRPRFVRQPDGTYVNTDLPSYRGAVLPRNPDGTTTLRYKDGMIWTFNAAGWLIAQRDRNGNQVAITRDGQNRVTSVLEPAGRALTFSYAGTDLKVQQVTDPLGRTVQYAYDSTNHLIRVTDPMGGVWGYTYDSAGRLATITDPRGIVTERNTYDSNGRVIQQVLADGGTFQISYQVTAGTVTQVTEIDPNGNRLVFRLNGGRFLTEATDGLGQATQTTRATGSNFIQSQTDALGRQTRYTYDGNGNLTSITDPLGNVRAFTYDPTFNQVLTRADPLGQTTTLTYDATGNLIQITNPLGQPTSFTYNLFGQQLSLTDALGNTTAFGYDGAGNLTATIDPLGNRTERTYDGVSRLIGIKDPRGAVSQFTYDALDHLVTTTDALNGVTVLGYDPNGNLVTVTDARGNTVSSEYDSRNRLSKRTDALGRMQTFTYDFNGNPRTVTDRKGQATTFTYDALNRRVRAQFADGSLAQFQYDAVGRLVQADDAADPHRPIVLDYDILDRLAAETTAMGTVSYMYDALGRRNQMTVSGQAPVAYTYDAASRLRTIAQASLAPVDIQYDALGRRTSLTLPNGVSTEYQYDTASRLTALIYRNALGVLGDLQYTHDPSGNRVAVGGSFARTLLPDAIPSAAYDAANRQLTFGGTTMTFDDNGNLATLTEGTTTSAFMWDARNQLGSMSGPTLNASFSYDGKGRRAARRAGPVESRYRYDGLEIVSLSTGGGEVAILRNLGIDEPLVHGSSGYLLRDGLGSIMGATGSGGTMTAEFSYEPFGRTELLQGSTASAFQFTARENDGTGLYFYRARYYAPALQRFVSEDPLTLAAGDVNAYAYAVNNPVLLVDPLGLTTWPGRGTPTKPGQEFGAPRGTRRHDGLDIPNPYGADVLASDNGIVQSTKPSPLGGNQVIIYHPDDGSVTGYAHVAPTVSEGQAVREGEPIGKTDRSGHTLGPHVHYTYRPCATCPKTNPRGHLPPTNNYGNTSGPDTPEGPTPEGPSDNPY